MKRNLITGLIIFLTALLLVVGNQMISDSLIQERNQRIEVVHENTLNEFSKAIKGFGLFVASVQSYINEQETFPPQDRLFRFVQQIARNTEYEDKFVISILDTTHTFLYSFDYSQIDPSQLIGQNLEEIIGAQSLLKYEEVMKDDQLHLFKPHNLVEGKVGISLNFRIKNQGNTIGYVTPIIDFKAVMEEVYQQNAVEEFIFHFSTKEGIDFDRERVHDQTKVYHEREDSLYYKNYLKTNTNFTYSDLSIYGFDFVLGTAYRESSDRNWIPTVSMVWFMIFTFLLIYANRQSTKLERTNNQVEKQKHELTVRNLELNQANSAKNKFISILGHDIKSPLGSIRDFIDIYQNDKVSKEETDYMMNELRKVTAKTIDLVENLLDWARINNRSIKPDFQPIDLSQIIEEVVSLLTGAAHMKEITLDSVLHTTLSISGDKDMVSTIFRNIISNAIKFTNRGGKVGIEGGETQDYVLVEISDNGVGLPPEKMEELFQFDKENQSYGTEGEAGTGLGLLLVKEYMDVHCGSIEVSSEINKGTTFSLKFPKK